MSLNVSQIIKINTRITPAGLGTANFAEAMLFVPKSDGTKGSLQENQYYVYTSITEVAEAFAPETEAYKACSAWLGGIPSINKVMVWVRDPLDSSWADTLNKAREKVWWYWTFLTKVAYEQADEVKQVADWCEKNSSMFVNCQTGAGAESIRDNTESDDIASELTKAGYRHCFTACHATDAYSGFYLAKHFAKVNYSATKSTITGEYKKSSGLVAEDLTATENNTMMLPTKKAPFYSTVEGSGSVDMGRWINTVTHSTYGEYIDDVVNLDAFVNSLEVALYNMVANQTTKLPQDTTGQAMLIKTAENVCMQFIDNGYLGERTFTDPDDAQEKYVNGYQMLSKAEDILTISDADRNARKSAPIRVRIFRAGAIHTVAIDVDVF